MTSFKLQESPRKVAHAFFNQVVPAGEGWMREIKQGQVLRILDLEGNQAVDTLFFNARDTQQHYSAQHTLVRQQAVYLTTGSRLYSSANQELAVIVADTCGRHDTLGGACASESNQVRYSLDKRDMHSCRDTFLLQLANWQGPPLTKRDLVSNINFFMNVPVTPQGRLTFEDGVSAPGKYVEIQALADLIVLISNCPQLNNPCNAYNPTPIQVFGWQE